VSEEEARPTAPGRGSQPPERVGSEYAMTRDIVVLTCVLLVLAVGLGTVLIEAWPPSAPRVGSGAAAQEHPARVRILFWTPALLRDVRLFLIVLAAGGLGALIHTLRSLYEYVGNRLLRRSWLLMYTLEPVVGAVLALVVYCVIRGGLTTTMASAGDINPYGMAALAALVGMFSRQTVQKLLAVFETLLAPAARTADPMPGRNGSPPDPSGSDRRPAPGPENRSDPGPDR